MTRFIISMKEHGSDLLCATHTLSPNFFRGGGGLGPKMKKWSDENAKLVGKFFDGQKTWFPKVLLSSLNLVLDGTCQRSERESYEVMLTNQSA